MTNKPPVKIGVKRIGNDYVSKMNVSKKIKTEALQLFSVNDIKNISNLNVREKIIYQWGSKKLKKYLNQKGRFYVTSYVRYCHPYDETDLSQKMILLQKREIEDLLYPLNIFKFKYSGQIHPENIKHIFQDFVKAIIGEKDIASSKMSVNELYKQQFGISLRSAHKLLSIPYKDIESGRFVLTDEGASELSNYLTRTYEKLKKICDSSNFFIMFGQKYIWVEASIQP